MTPGESGSRGQGAHSSSICKSTSVIVSRTWDRVPSAAGARELLPLGPVTVRWSLRCRSALASFPRDRPGRRTLVGSASASNWRCQPCRGQKPPPTKSPIRPGNGDGWSGYAPRREPVTTNAAWMEATRQFARKPADSLPLPYPSSPTSSAPGWKAYPASRQAPVEDFRLHRAELRFLSGVAVWSRPRDTVAAWAHRLEPLRKLRSGLQSS